MKNKVLTIDSRIIPSIFIDYLKVVRSMEFEETPNYLILIDMLKREIN
jgi:hypothetical protein